MQYKSSVHFESIQRLSDKYDIKIIHLFGIPEHGKGEVDHVEGIAKTAIRREIATGAFFEEATSMVEFLQDKFFSHINPKYIIKEIKEHEVHLERVKAKLKTVKTIDGSIKFQAMLFMPESNVIKASRICICNTCKLGF